MGIEILAKDFCSGEWVFYAEMDEHTCLPCKEMHGKTLSGILPGKPPQERCENEVHKCRCVLKWEEVNKPLQEIVESNQTCPKRVGELGPWKREEGLDAWVKRGDDRVCSFCGSIHPDDLLKICKQVDGLKTYLTMKDRHGGPLRKIYIYRPTIANATEGAIKFYTVHVRSLPEDQINKAVRVIEKALTLTQAYDQERFQEARDMIQRLAKEKEEEEEEIESEEEKIIKIVKSHRKADGSFGLFDAVNEIRRTFPILGLKGSKEALDKAKTEIWIREESLLKTIQKEEG